MDGNSLNNSLEQAQNLTQTQSSPLDLLLSAAQSTEGDRQVSLKTLKQQEIDKIMQSFKQCREIADRYYTSKVEPKLKERREIYLARADHYKKKFKRLSELTSWCSRDVKTTIDWILPSLIEVYTGGDDPIDIKGVNVEDDDRARKLQQLLKYQMERKNSYFTFLDTVLKDALILNMGAAKVWWKREEKREAYEMLLNTQDVQMTALLLQEYQKGSIEIRDMEPIEGAPDLFKVTFDKVSVTANHPVLEYLPPSELRYTPEASNLQSAKFTAHRKVVRGDYLIRKEKEGVYENVREALAKYSGNTRYTAYDREHNPELSNAPAKLSDNDTASKEVELYEGYLQVDYNNDGVFEDVIVHAVGDTPIRIAGNDFEMAPFFVCAAEYDPSVVFGEESFADNLEQLQDLKTALVRQIIINVAKNNAPQKFVNETNVDMDALINNEEHVPVMGTNGSPRDNVFVPDPLPLSPATMTLVEYAQNEIEAQSGSTRYNQGLDSNSLNKMLALDTPIPMADGSYKKNGDIVAGDFVIGSNGKPTEVLYAHPVQMPKRAFRIKFRSGDVIKAGGEHRWSVKVSDKNYRHKSPEWEKLPTERIYDLMQSGYRVTIPCVEKVEFTEKDLSMDPYIFGLWLGDGNSHTNRFTSMDSEIVEAFTAWAKQFYKGSVEKTSQQNSGRAHMYQIVNTPFRRMLKDMGCLKDSRYVATKDNVKHIPEIYLQGSFEQRIALLRGLMDTDGCIDKNGNAIFCNSEPALIDGVVRLIESLGGKPNVNWKGPDKNGNKFKHSKPHAHVTFAMPFCPVKLQRKVERWKTKKRYWDEQRIDSIEEIPIEAMRCLTVAAKDELYCCGRRLTLTSNTATGITAIMGSAEKRLKHYAKQMAENFVVPLFRFLILLNQKYLEEAQMIRLTNENVVIRKEELDIDYDLMINVGQGAGTREAQIQYLMILINQIYPQLAQQGIVTPNSWYQIVKDLLEKMGVRNTAAYLADPNAPEMQQKQQQVQQQAMQAQQMQMQAEIAKASVPKVSVKLEDLPTDAKLQFITQKLGLQTTPQNVAEKELVDHA